MAAAKSFRVYLWNGRSGGRQDFDGVRYEWIKAGPDQPFTGVKLYQDDGQETLIFPGKYALAIEER